MKLREVARRLRRTVTLVIDRWIDLTQEDDAKVAVPRHEELDTWVCWHEAAHAAYYLATLGPEVITGIDVQETDDRQGRVSTHMRGTNSASKSVHCAVLVGTLAAGRVTRYKFKSPDYGSARDVECAWIGAYQIAGLEHEIPLDEEYMDDRVLLRPAAESLIRAAIRCVDEEISMLLPLIDTIAQELKVSRSLSVQKIVHLWKLHGSPKIDHMKYF